MKHVAKAEADVRAPLNVVQAALAEFYDGTVEVELAELGAVATHVTLRSDDSPSAEAAAETAAAWQAMLDGLHPDGSQQGGDAPA